MAYHNKKKNISANIILLVYFLVFMLLANSDTGEALLCERASQTWSGKCGNTQHCDNQCRTWENAEHGACHGSGNKKKCYCYFKQC